MVDLNAKVPIIGLALDAYECFALVTIKCRCHEENHPMLLRSVEGAIVCNRCRRMYAITALNYERGKTQVIQAAVAVVGMMPEVAAS